MKRRRLLRYLEEHGCHVVREGGRHTIVENLADRRRSPVPRHPEVDTYTMRDICKQLDIPIPPER